MMMKKNCVCSLRFDHNIYIYIIVVFSIKAVAIANCSRVADNRILVTDSLHCYHPFAYYFAITLVVVVVVHILCRSRVLKASNPVNNLQKTTIRKKKTKSRVQQSHDRPIENTKRFDRDNNVQPKKTEREKRNWYKLFNWWRVTDKWPYSICGCAVISISFGARKLKKLD